MDWTLKAAHPPRRPSQPKLAKAAAERNSIRSEARLPPSSGDVAMQVRRVRVERSNGWARRNCPRRRQMVEEAGASCKSMSFHYLLRPLWHGARHFKKIRVVALYP
jgi:hypothetical protein